jgi:hypothetical protein
MTPLLLPLLPTKPSHQCHLAKYLYQLCMLQAARKAHQQLLLLDSAALQTQAPLHHGPAAQAAEPHLLLGCLLAGWLLSCPQQQQSPQSQLPAVPMLVLRVLACPHLLPLQLL